MALSSTIDTLAIAHVLAVVTNHAARAEEGLAAERASPDDLARRRDHFPAAVVESSAPLALQRKPVSGEGQA